MVTVIDEIPKKEAEQFRIPKRRPKIDGIPGIERISWGDVVVPKRFNKKLLNRSDVDVRQSGYFLGVESVKDRIRDAAREKDTFLRYINGNPIALVTEKFEEIDAKQIAKNIEAITGAKPVVRYFFGNESLQMNFPIATQFPGMYLTVNTGPYGTYGGSGQNAVQYGISWFNKTCSNWTVFLNKELKQKQGRLIHRNDCSQEGIEKLIASTDNIVRSIEESKTRTMDVAALASYLNAYEEKGLPKQITGAILKENPRGTSVYDLSYKMTELVQNPKLSDITRSRVEFMAGEIILCYDKIMQNIAQDAAAQIMAGNRNAGIRTSSPRDAVYTPQRFSALHYVAK